MSTKKWFEEQQKEYENDINYWKDYCKILQDELTLATQTVDKPSSCAGVIPKIMEEAFDQIHNILCESKFGMNDPKARVKILGVLNNISMQYNELTDWLYDKHPKIYESYFNGE